MFYDSSLDSSLSLSRSAYIYRGVVMAWHAESFESTYIFCIILTRLSVRHARLHIFITISAAQQQYWVDVNEVFWWKEKIVKRVEESKVKLYG